MRMISVVGMLSVVGTLGAVACSSDRADPSEDVSSVEGAIGVLDWPALPLCTILNRGIVYYVKSTQSLTYCDGNKFQPLDVQASGGGYLVTTTAASLATCPTGGVVIQAGPNANHDGVLDNVKVAAPVCNGATGPQGPKGDKGDKGDAGADGKAGANSLVDVKSEPVGTNCANGGQRIDVGTDKNSDGILQPTEVTKTTYVCNGSSANNGVVCVVNGSVYAIGTAAPGNTCQVCSPSSSSTAFTNLANNTPCSGGFCQSGACASGCLIDGNFYSAGTSPAENVCLTCAPGMSSTAFSNTLSGTACGDNKTCNLATCELPCAPPALTNAYFADGTETNLTGWTLTVSGKAQLTPPFPLVVQPPSVPLVAIRALRVESVGNSGIAGATLTQSFTVCSHPNIHLFAFAAGGESRADVRVTVSATPKAGGPSIFRSSGVLPGRGVSGDYIGVDASALNAHPNEEVTLEVFLVTNVVGFSFVQFEGPRFE